MIVKANRRTRAIKGSAYLGSVMLIRLCEDFYRSFEYKISLWNQHQHLPHSYTLGMRAHDRDDSHSYTPHTFTQTAHTYTDTVAHTHLHAHKRAHTHTLTDTRALVQCRLDNSTHTNAYDYADDDHTVRRVLLHFSYNSLACRTADERRFVARGFVCVVVRPWHCIGVAARVRFACANECGSSVSKNGWTICIHVQTKPASYLWPESRSGCVRLIHDLRLCALAADPLARL